MTWRGLLIVVMLLGAVAASWLVGGSVVEQAGPASRPVPDAGYYFEDVSFLETGADGAVIYEVAAEVAVQSPAGEGVAFNQVHLDYNASGEGPWVLDATRGRIPEDRNMIELSGGVTIRSEQGDAPTVVETESLTVDPARQLATTADEVRIRIGPHTLTGTGMQARLDEGYLELQSRVHGRFIP